MKVWKESQLTQLSYAQKMETAYEISLNLVKNLGFNFCAFSITSQRSEIHRHNINLNNYPTEWNTKYEQEHFSEVDPILAHCNHSELPILWQEEIFSKTPTLRQAQKQQGLRYGWSQSVHDQNGLCSMLSLARSHCPITTHDLYKNLGYAMFISRHLHGLVAKDLPSSHPKPNPVHLSIREVEVLKYSAIGKTAGEIARILSLSESTVQFHIRGAIRKLGVNNKIAAVIKAARMCVI
ncbi:response regulator containing a CheY-like receiver domain and an HTH DNA-binding domain [Pseudomonas sp. GM102]|uniref:autoinducer binding domain-containing protein n=1 Tax=Pseudomonas sp. GM102 TaxID=1144321 RepID=UPI00026FCDF5|nr:autoinducer binding domain-containing protein [Pseudomonas sp. GM102]EJM07223.1 response regulator containing a CheY-like receiver domain and an HTH DNA-binding domain [Pseudomonas sp. GM102]